MSQAKELITSFRFRQDTLANWNLANPILKDGEFILIKDTAEYKVGNGVSKFSELPVRGVPAVQDKGQSILNVMSQKAVTDELNRLDGVNTNQTSEINAVKSGKFDKSSILTTYPSSEPESDSTIVSAKQQYKKDKEQADKMFQLDQELSVARGGVQGVSISKNDSILFPNSIALNDFTVCFWVQLKELKTIQTEFFCFNNQYYKIFYDGYNIAFENTIDGDFTQASKVTIPSNQVLNNYVFIALRRSGQTECVYANGVKGNDIIKPKANITSFQFNKGLTPSNIANIDIANYRLFNQAINPVDLDYIYNKGRVDEVVLGDEWRLSYNTLFDFHNNNTNAFVAGDDTTITPSVDGLIANSTGANCVVIRWNIDMLNSNYKIRIRLKENISINDCLLRIKDNTGYLNFNIVDGLSELNISNRELQYFLIIFPSISSVTIESISIVSVTLLNEYLPAYLTKTKWIDNGVSKQDNALTAPTFTYIKPYKKYSFGSGSPSTPPNAAGQQYFDTATGRLWISRPLPSPIVRQFEVADWGNPINK